MEVRHKDNCAIISPGKKQLTLSQWYLLLDEVDRLDSDAVIDAREVTGSLTEIESYLLALRANESSHLRRHRLAVVLSDDPHPELDFFVLSARNLGLAVKSFGCTDTATAWAGGGERNA